MDRMVTVWGKAHAVKLSQSSRTSFTASGNFQGEVLFARGHSAAAALAAWATSAKSKAPKQRA
ncbi:MAG: hypothetical protein WDN45_08835 [Caulobacteraceae bacterium]